MYYDEARLDETPQVAQEHGCRAHTGRCAGQLKAMRDCAAARARRPNVRAGQPDGSRKSGAFERARLVAPPREAGWSRRRARRADQTVDGSSEPGYRTTKRSGNQAAGNQADRVIEQPNNRTTEQPDKRSLTDPFVSIKNIVHCEVEGSRMALLSDRRPREHDVRFGVVRWTGGARTHEPFERRRNVQSLH